MPEYQETSIRVDRFFFPRLSTIFAYIIHFQNLKSIASMGFKSLVSLETLLLEACPRLRSVVTKGGLPLMLVELQIKDCSILKKWCLKDEGKDWLKIAYIPNVLIDEIIQQQANVKAFNHAHLKKLSTSQHGITSLGDKRMKLC
ncbi:hypothetical protein CK203_051054 [Vitis vinifera]|uniref:Disease resistance protein n=1 Tax=Vitis vinifera TaxID=29760 RepID=A0A438GPW4_VITVI|nr:hypothetical protein CK203_051054 [Vitis vinifera]